MTERRQQNNEHNRKLHQKSRPKVAKKNNSAHMQAHLERTNLAQVKVYRLLGSSLAYQLSMAAHVVTAVRQGYSMQYALSEIEMDDEARANVQRLSFETMRHWGCTHFWLTHFIPNAPTIWVQALLSVALTQLRQESISEFVLVDQAVIAAENFKPHAKGMVNAILRRFLRERTEWEQLATGDMEATHNYPLWWIDEVRAVYPHEWQIILAVGNSHPAMTLRVNARQYSTHDYLKLLNEQGISAQAMPKVSAEAILLDIPSHVNKLPEFAQGAVSVQDAGAQYAVDLLDLHDGLRVLDACAAPGGKTGHILERQNVSLIALEKDEVRAQRIHDNLDRLKLKANVVVCDANNVHQWWDGQPFDRILLDAPCSASGIVRRHPDIRWLRVRNDLEGLARQQAQLLRTMWKVLAEKGRLVYCTCSIFTTEGEQIIQTFLKHTPNAKRIELSHAQLLPRVDDHYNHDGFFYAVLIKE